MNHLAGLVVSVRVIVTVVQMDYCVYLLSDCMAVSDNSFVSCIK